MILMRSSDNKLTMTIIWMKIVMSLILVPARIRSNLRELVLVPMMKKLEKF